MKTANEMNKLVEEVKYNKLQEVKEQAKKIAEEKIAPQIEEKASKGLSKVCVDKTDSEELDKLVSDYLTGFGYKVSICITKILIEW